jgi:hypothetical protein
MKNIKRVLVLAVIMLTGSLVTSAQKKSADEVKRMVESLNYVFKAEMANPQGSVSRFLTSEYDLVVTRDTVISFLPYFGRAYSAPINPSEGGIKFTSVKFDYKQSNDGKRWKIDIRPKDASDVQQLYLDIFDNGSATLQVISTNRQTISFNGYVEENKARGKKAF